jgi:GNAT superfamily N-acetyltransferase
MSHIEQIPAELTWQIRRKVLYPDLDPEISRLPDDDLGMHFGLFENNTLISVASLFKNGSSMQVRKFATLAEYQGQGYGSTLLQYLLDFSKTEGCVHIWCNARKSASEFYDKFAFSQTEKTFNKNGHDYVIMEKK